MNYVSIYDCTTRKRLAFLENAYDVGYAKQENAVWDASFSLPSTDPKNEYCKDLNYVEIFDGDRYIGLFRITNSNLSKTSQSKAVEYSCEHVIATLIDDILVGWHEIGNTGVYTTEVLRYILDRQTVQRWKLGSCDFSHQYLYGWQDENLLTALFSVPNCFAEKFVWEFDTESYPWTISLKIAPVKAKTDVRFRKNMLGITKKTDSTQLATRLYPFGYGEGDNRLTIAKVNPTGKMYIDSNTQDKYGIISKVWVDQRYENEESLYSAAVSMLEELKVPQITYTVNTAHIGGLFDCNVGDIVRVADDDEGIDIYATIVKIQKNDIYGKPNECIVTIGNKSSDIATTVADLNDRQRIKEVYSQGAMTLFTSSFNDNCSPEEPADMRFYIPQNTVHINQIILNGRATPFRGYTKATKGGGATATTTSAGGGASTTSASGGGASCTSSSGGGGTYTSESGGYSSNTTGSGYVTVSVSTNQAPTSDSGSYYGYTDSSQGGLSYYASYGPSSGTYHTHNYARPGSHSHYISIGTHRHTFSHGHGAVADSHTHSFTTPSHAHSVNIGSHTHAVSVPTHTHSFSISSHSHNFSIPDHTHEIEYGIYKGTTAATLQATIDNLWTLSWKGNNIADIDIIKYLSKDDDGNVTRGWHTISIKPDKLSRVAMNLVVQLFANSRGGGQY